MVGRQLKGTAGAVPERVFTVEELARYDGRNPDRLIYLSIK